MAILRKRQRTNFTIVSNDILNDTSLSFKARGIAVYLLSKPDNWVVNWKNLAENSTDGRDAILTGMTELKEKGYLKRDKAQDDKGRWSTAVMVADTPQEEWLLELQPDTDNPYSATLDDEPEKPDTDNPPPSTGFPAVGKPVPIVKTERVKTENTYCYHNKYADKSAKPLTEHQLMFGKLCEITGTDYEVSSKVLKAKVGRVAKALAEKYTVADLDTFKDWWFKNDWRGAKGQFPTPENVWDNIGKLHASMPEIYTNGNGKVSKVAASLAACDEVEQMLREQGLIQ